jgi:hypothetical protein
MKGLTVKVWHLALLFTVVGALIALGIVYHLRKVDRLSDGLSEANTEIKYYKIVVGNLQESVTENKLRVVSQEKALVLSQKEIERMEAVNLRNVQTIGSLQLQISSMKDSLTLFRDTVRVPVEYIPITEDGDVIEGEGDRPMVELPFSFSTATEWSRSWAAVGTNGLGTIGFEVTKLPINITLGSRGVFRKDYVSIVTTPNPEVSVSAQNFQIVKQERWKPIIYSGVTGLILGGLIVAVIQ